MCSGALGRKRVPGYRQMTLLCHAYLWCPLAFILDCIQGVTRSCIIRSAWVIKFIAPWAHLRIKYCIWTQCILARVIEWLHEFWYCYVRLYWQLCMALSLFIVFGENYKISRRHRAIAMYLVKSRCLVVMSKFRNQRGKTNRHMKLSYL